MEHSADPNGHHPSFPTSQQVWPASNERATPVSNNQVTSIFNCESAPTTNGSSKQPAHGKEQPTQKPPPPLTRTGPPSITVRRACFVSFEHPCIISNIDKGIASLGGPLSIEKFLNINDADKTLGVSLRPDDKLAKRMPSKQVQVNQILLKVTAPKWTGRKRRRGTDNPFLSESEIRNDTSRIKKSFKDPRAVYRAIRDNPDMYAVDAIGEIKESHRVRSMPDYQYATSTNTLMARLRDTIMTTDMAKIKNFGLDGVKGLPKTQDVGPPPFFSVIKQPFNYNFRQNPYVKIFTDETGAVTSVNVTAPAKYVKYYLDCEDPNIPLARPAELEPEITLEPRVRECLAKLRAELEKRPMMQRRVYSNMFKGQNEIELKRAAGYAGYTFTSGPFKDVLIKFGIDPRSDPKYRIYQGVSFQIAGEEKGALEDTGAYLTKRKGKRDTSNMKKWEPDTHIFDGTKVHRDGKIWQVCDIIDPYLRRLLDTTELRETCDMSFSGWYGNGTWSLLRVIMKDKIRTLNEGKTPNDEMYVSIEKMFPAFITDKNVKETAPDSSGTLQRSNQIGFPVDTATAMLATQVRAMAMAAFRHSSRNGRIAKKKKKKRGKWGSAAASVSGTDADSEIGDVDTLPRADFEDEDETLLDDGVGSEDDDQDDDGDVEEGDEGEAEE